MGSRIQGNGDCEWEVEKRVQPGWMESVEKNDGNAVQQEGTNKDQLYYLKNGCGAGDDVRTGVSSDDKETGRQLEVPEMRTLRFSQLHRE